MLALAFCSLCIAGMLGLEAWPRRLSRPKFCDLGLGLEGPGLGLEGPGVGLGLDGPGLGLGLEGPGLGLEGPGLVNIPDALRKFYKEWII